MLHGTHSIFITCLCDHVLFESGTVALVVKAHPFAVSTFASTSSPLHSGPLEG